jgi:hypothetical protein
VIGPIIMADRPTIVQFYHNNLPTTSVNLTLGENLIVPVSVSSDNLTFLTSLRIFVSNQTVISASWKTLGQDLEIHGLTIGQSQHIKSRLAAATFAMDLPFFSAMAW